MGGSSSSELGGVRVFKVSPGGPAAEAGLEVYFDFIVEVNGKPMDNSGQQAFAEKIAACENQAAKFTVYNTRAHSKREVSVTPRKWGGTGLLGATVRYDVVDPAENQGIRVLEVFPNSPAAHAGLVPFQDFMLGTAQTVFHDIDELVEVVTTNINERLQVYVYNTDSETVREVILVPNTEWGGEGCIGCDIGTGLLHRIPAPRRPPGAPPIASAPGQFTTANGIPPPVYPPGVAAPPAVPGGAVVPPPAVPGAAVVPPAVPGVPGAPVPGVIVPGGLPTVPPGVPGAVVAPKLPPGGHEVARVAGVTWPPPAPAGTEAPVLPAEGLAASPTGNVADTPISAAGPRAPPGTPMDPKDVPPQPDLTSAMDPFRFRQHGAELYQPSPDASQQPGVL